MTEHPTNQKSQLHHIYSHPQHKRPLTSANTSSFNYGTSGCEYNSISSNSLSSSNNINELTESHLRENVQIVLNNLNRNALRCYLNERLNNNFGKKMLSSPESDCNSNPHIGGQLLGCSIASSQDFTHDNSDYQWFLDYGYVIALLK